jgi:hypothetical protein
MNYKELRNAVRQFKVEGLTDVKLNASQEVLQAEYNQVIEQLEIDQMMSKLDGFTTKEVLEMVENIEANLETYEDSKEQTKDNSLAIDRYIEIIEKTLTVKFHCDYKINRSMIIENKEKTVKEFLSQVAKESGVYTTDLLFAVEINIENDLSYPEYKLGKLRHDSLNSFLKHFTDFLLETEQPLEKTTPETYEETTFELAVDRFIERVEKTLVVNFSCDYKANRSMVLENKNLTVKEFLAKVAKDADVNKIDFLLAVEQKIEDDFNFDLTDYRYDLVDYFLEKFTIDLTQNEETTPPVLEIVTSETDTYFDTAVQYFVNATNHVFKRFGSDYFTTTESLRLSMVNDVTVNDFIKFLNLNTGFDLTEFMEYLEYHLEDQYQYFIQYSSLDYRKCPIKMILQDFAYSIDLYQLVA